MEFSRKFPEERDWALDKEGKWLPLNVVLALFIYGVVLFPNDDDYINPSIISVFAKIEENLKEKYQDDLAQANMGLTSLRKQLKQTEKECGDNHPWFDLVVKEKKALRYESDLEIQKLKLSLCNANAKVEVESRLKEEAV
ncbi:hypothetical protein KIW84_056546 [Lathyrus oleraceus]|uniref:DUF7745 domain-containing protein n=1 Tax=Pisum sativum TaxID=3888 RepID=A0A9D5ALJ7_PEA|nr:hypothetical protein KIW84_056546 [Pisum sativum]